MKLIENGIVFSNDIKRIMMGKNALNFNYGKKGIIIPDENFFEYLRSDFKNTVDEIFDSVIILKESEMLESINESIKDVFGRYPHCIA